MILISIAPSSASSGWVFFSRSRVRYAWARASGEPRVPIFTNAVFWVVATEEAASLEPAEAAQRVTSLLSAEPAKAAQRLGTLTLLVVETETEAAALAFIVFVNFIPKNSVFFVLLVVGDAGLQVTVGRPVAGAPPC